MYFSACLWMYVCSVKQESFSHQKMLPERKENFKNMQLSLHFISHSSRGHNSNISWHVDYGSDQTGRQRSAPRLAGFWPLQVCSLPGIRPPRPHSMQSQPATGWLAMMGMEHSRPAPSGKVSFLARLFTVWSSPQLPAVRMGVQWVVCRWPEATCQDGQWLAGGHPPGHSNGVV